MKDLISRQAAIDAVKKNTFRLTFAEEQNCEGHVAWSANAVYSDAIEGTLLELPSAQPERLKGHWIPLDEDSDEYECDVCRTTYDTVGGTWDLPYFCPHCGADMRGEQNG